MSRPWLTVVMPTYNGAHYVEAALDSVVEQRPENLEEIELIAVDDGSTDATVEIVERYSRRLPLRIVQRGHSGNWVANTNVAMSLARGRYVCWLHQDDAWFSARLKFLRRWTSQWPDAVLFLHPAWFIDAQGEFLGLWNSPLPCKPEGLGPEETMSHLLVQNFIPLPSALFRKDAADRAGRPDERLWYLADWDYWLRLAAQGTTVYRPVPLCSFRLHRESLTSQCVQRIEDVEEQYTIVQRRHLEPREAEGGTWRRVGRVSRFSMELNLALMRFLAGKRARFPSLAWHFLRLGPSQWFKYFHNSRIIERCVSRIRARKGIAQAKRNTERTRACFEGLLPETMPKNEVTQHGQ